LIELIWRHRSGDGEHVDGRRQAGCPSVTLAPREKHRGWQVTSVRRGRVHRVVCPDRLPDRGS
jgi:hypothetical protein